MEGCAHAGCARPTPWVCGSPRHRDSSAWAVEGGRARDRSRVVAWDARVLRVRRSVFSCKLGLSVSAHGIGGRSEALRSSAQRSGALRSSAQRSAPWSVLSASEPDP